MTVVAFGSGALALGFFVAGIFHHRGAIGAISFIGTVAFSVLSALLFKAERQKYPHS
jgi:hypothetical protein